MQAVTGQCSSPADSDNGEVGLQAILDSYTSRLDDLVRTDVIVLTGSTGSLGSYFLDSLIRKRCFAKIICLNRRGGDVEKQRNAHRSRGLTEDFASVQFLEVKLSEPRLGLEEMQYSTLIDEATHIFHGAWQVNFNLPMSSFRSQLDGCHRLIELAHQSRKHVAVTFISSVGAANHWAYIYEGAVPEQALGDFAVAEPMGYAQSKLLAELLFLHANKRLGIPVTVCRVGQIAGPVKSRHGAWNASEWFPSLILSAKVLGKLPLSLGAMDRIDWLPVDLLGDMLVETVTRNEAQQQHSIAHAPATEEKAVPALSSPAEFFHFVNPLHDQWRDVAPKLAARMLPRPRLVPYAEWLQALTAASEQEQRLDGDQGEVAGEGELETLNAVKLLDFFADIGRSEAKRPVFSTTRTEQACPGLRASGPVSLDWLLLWLEQWGVRVDGGGDGDGDGDGGDGESDGGNARVE